MLAGADRNEVPSNKMLAGKLGLSVGSIKVYFRSIFQKLAISNRASVLAYALKNREFVERLDEPWPFDEYVA